MCGLRQDRRVFVGPGFFRVSSLRPSRVKVSRQEEHRDKTLHCSCRGSIPARNPSVFCSSQRVVRAVVSPRWVGMTQAVPARVALVRPFLSVRMMHSPDPKALERP